MPDLLLQILAVATPDERTTLLGIGRRHNMLWVCDCNRAHALTDTWCRHCSQVRRWECPNCQWDNVATAVCGGCAPTPAPDPAASPLNPPGCEYPYAVSDIARKSAELLGKGWGSESGDWGVTGQIHTPTGDKVVIGVDHDGDLYVNGPTSLEPVYLERETAPHDPDALTAVAKRVAEVTRDIT